MTAAAWDEGFAAGQRALQFDPRDQGYPRNPYANARRTGRSPQDKSEDHGNNGDSRPADSGICGSDA